jgi:Holliday junction resolvase
VANRSKQKGTAAETAVVRFLQDSGWPHAERRTLSGAHDKGDISGVVGVSIEVKDHKTISLSEFLSEALVEKENAGAKVGFAWIKKRMTTNPGNWYVLMDGYQVVELLKDAGY